MIFQELSISQFLYGKTVPHHNVWFQNVKKLCCDNIVNVRWSLRILCYCTPTAESSVLFLQKRGCSLHCHCHIALENVRKLPSFCCFQ